jgi:hypothetical protein
LMDLQKL